MKKTPIVNMKEHVDPLLNDLLHENKYPTMDEISDKLAGLTSRIAITHKQYSDWFEEKKSEVQDRMRHIRAYLGQKIREMFCEVYGLDLDLSADPEKKKMLLNPITSYKNQTANWEAVLVKACKPKEPSPNTRAWAEVIIDAFLNNKTLRDMGENAVIRAYKEKLGQPLPSVSTSITTTTPKKPKKRKKLNTKDPKKEDSDDDVSNNPSLIDQIETNTSQSVLQAIPTPTTTTTTTTTTHHPSPIMPYPHANMMTNFGIPQQSYMVAVQTNTSAGVQQNMNVGQNSSIPVVHIKQQQYMPHPDANMMENDEDGGSSEKRKD